MDLLLVPQYFIAITIGIVAFSIILDALIGDPHLKCHPVNGIGNAIQWFKRKTRSGNPRKDKTLGVILIFFVAAVFGVPLVLFQSGFWVLLGMWDSNIGADVVLQYLCVVLYILGTGFWLKWSFAIRNLRDETVPIMKALQAGDLEVARKKLSMIVRRDTTVLSESYVTSATVEVIAESATDGITTPFWFYFNGGLFGVLLYATAEIVFPALWWNVLWLFLGIPFAYLFRTINTGDSIVGYKDAENLNIGWFTAKMDNLSHWATTPLTVGFMLLAGKIMGLDARNGIKVLKTDRKNTTSTNAGWTIGVMAGLLNVQLEKIGHYKLGNPMRALTPGDIAISFKVVHIASTLCIIFLTGMFLIPISFLL